MRRLNCQQPLPQHHRRRILRLAAKLLRPLPQPRHHFFLPCRSQRQHPIVVTIGQQVAAVKGSRLQRGRSSHCHLQSNRIKPHRGIGVKGNGIAAGEEGVGGQRFSERGQGGTQGSPRLGIADIAPKEGGQLFTAVETGVKSQVGQQGFGFARGQGDDQAVSL